MSVTKDPLEPHDIGQPTAEDSDERVKTPHTEMCEESEVTSVEEGHDVDGRHAPQSDETAAGNLKQLKDEMSAYLTAFEKKGLDRRTDQQAETQTRSARPPPWRDKLRIEGESVDADEKNTDGNTGPDEVFDISESLLWLALSYLGAQGCNPRRGDEFHASKQITRSITQMMQMNWKVMDSSRNRKHVSRSMMIKAKNIIIKERIWINRVINEATIETHWAFSSRPSEQKC